MLWRRLGDEMKISRHCIASRWRWSVTVSFLPCKASESCSGQKSMYFPWIAGASAFAQPCAVLSILCGSKIQILHRYINEPFMA